MKASVFVLSQLSSKNRTFLLVSRNVKVRGNLVKRLLNKISNVIGSACLMKNDILLDAMSVIADNPKNLKVSAVGL